MILVCTFDVQDDVPIVRRQMIGKGFWLIKMWTTNGVERIEKEVRNKTKARLMEFHDRITEEFAECIAELSPITDGGFEIYFLRK